MKKPSRIALETAQKITHTTDAYIEDAIVRGVITRRDARVLVKERNRIAQIIDDVRREDIDALLSRLT